MCLVEDWENLCLVFVLHESNLRIKVALVAMSLMFIKDERPVKNIAWKLTSLTTIILSYCFELEVTGDCLCYILLSTWNKNLARE